MLIINWAELTSPPGGRRMVIVSSKSLTASKRKSAAKQTRDIRRSDGETERPRDGGTERRRDGETERPIDVPSLYLSVSPSLSLSVSLSLCLSISPSFSTPTTGGQPAAIRFTDVTAQSGINFKHVASPEKKYLAESMSGGLAVFDYDNDGYLDIYFVNSLNVDLM